MNTGTDRRRANWHWKENDVIYEFASEIGLAGICVYDVLTMFARNTGEGSERVAWPSTARIADALSVTKPTVRSALQRLEEVGLVRVERRCLDGVNTSHHYTLLDVQDAIQARKEAAKTPQEGDKNLPGGINSILPPGIEFIPPSSKIYTTPGINFIPELDNEEHRQLNNEESYDDDDGGRPGEPSTGNRHMVEQPLTPALDTEWGTAFSLFQSQLGWMGGAGPTLDEMREYFDELRSKGLTDWWALAVKVAVDQNARSWAYVRQVLRTALESHRPPGSPKAQKGSNASNGTHRNGHGPGYSGKPYDDGLSSLTTAEREALSAQLAATRNRQRSLPGV